MFKRLLRASALLAFLPLASAALSTGVTHAATTCTPTGFVRDSMNLTAAEINPSGSVQGDVDAAGCNIGIYYGPGSHGTVTHGNVYGSNYYGIVNNGGTVNVTQSAIHDIGETPLNGDQHGVAIYWAFGSIDRGNITRNVIWDYQKGGIVVNGAGSSSNVDGNVVLGQGPVNYIAQNGIQFGYGSTGSITNNFVYGNSYTGANSASSGGILLVGGDWYGGPITSGVNVTNNILVGNDIGVWLSNLDFGSNPVNTPSNNTISNNSIANEGINNTTGDGPGAGYQAGISDQGDHDILQQNSISGAGYTTNPNPPPYLYCIDDTVTNNVVERHNSCPGSRHDSYGWMARSTGLHGLGRHITNSSSRSPKVAK